MREAWVLQDDCVEVGDYRRVKEDSGMPRGCDLPKHLLVVYYHWK